MAASVQITSITGISKIWQGGKDVLYHPVFRLIADRVIFAAHV